MFWGYCYQWPRQLVFIDTSLWTLNTCLGERRRPVFHYCLCQWQKNTCVKGKQSHHRLEISAYHPYIFIYSPTHTKFCNVLFPTGSHPHTAFVHFVMQALNYRPCCKTHLNLWSQYLSASLLRSQQGWPNTVGLTALR